MSTWPSVQYQFTLPMRYQLFGLEGKGVVVCLHGYQDHAHAMIKRIGWSENSALPFQVLAINAPFPVPVWTANGFREAYSWYFRDVSRNLFLVKPEDTVIHVARLINELGLKETPKVLFGFSQGGYLAPFLAKRLTQVAGIIGVGCGYNSENYQGLLPLKVFGIHGDKDERVSMQQSKADFQKLIAQGFSGEFDIVTGVAHWLDKRLEPRIRARAQELLLCNT